ncbi:hypothetical protein [Pseudodesulfovibrio sediminis]|uniref:Uncharacterized protein n=1 Tax=Pseudodesulfovibrio sediminis TaxID=2810563 RepID=A0ABN6EQU6_9BACT|nr:hypothetical protein [Pseudodesulfovibrio sediminis]BCS88786.1 hypothetical protein PSDVSF_20280 [Pseudodesulfovibrio sediminis]
MPRELRFFLEYMCFPLWISDEEGVVGTIDPESLSISDDLKHDIKEWDRIFQATLDQRYPPDSGFSSKYANELLWKAFDEEGKSLFVRLKQELNGIYKITSEKYDNGN